MKKFTLACASLLLSSILLAQEIEFDVRTTYDRSVKTNTLKDATTLEDLMPGYPSAWTSDYVSTEIQGISNGRNLKAYGLNNVLTAEQINIVRYADLGTDLMVNVVYRHKNPATDIIYERNVAVTLTVVPEKDAVFPGGEDQMSKYIQKNAISKIPTIKTEELGVARVRFTVDESGVVANPQVSQTSGDEKVDKLLIDTIHKMPKWKPAEELDGQAVKQEFELSVGSLVGDGC